MFTLDHKPQDIRLFMKRAGCKGFTLIEVVISVFIFAIIMMAVSQIFISAFRGYNYARAVQRDLEAAQFAINTLAKELRTSSVVSASGVQTFVQFVDYSQSICFKYRVSGSSLQVARKAGIKTFDSCQSTAFASGDFTTVSTGAVTGNFFVILSDPTVGSKKVGKVTISLVVSEGSHTARTQTTASLRDFGYIGLQ